MIGNVILFLKHVETKFIDGSKLKPSDFQSLYYELKRMSSDAHRGVTVHQHQVLRNKTGTEFFQILLSLDNDGWMCL